MTAGFPWIPSPFYYPGRGGYQVTAIVVHSVESEIRAGIARSLAEGWFKTQSGTSAHSIADQATEAEMVRDSDRAKHVGGGNGPTIGIEHAGRAAFTRAQWTTPDGLAMLRRSARYAAAIARKYGIPPRWLSVLQLRSGIKGFATHNDCRLAFGGTTHTDPGPNFPYDIYIRFVQAELEGEWPQVAMTEADEDRLAQMHINTRNFVKGYIEDAVSDLTEVVEGAAFWVAHLVMTGQLDAASRYAKGKFKDTPYLKQLVDDMKSHGNADVLAALEASHPGVPEEPPTDPPTDPPVEP